MALKENIMRSNPWVNQPVDKQNQVGYEDDRIGRLLEITNNLEKFYNENPDLFANEEEFKKNFHYDERSPMQQALVQGFRNKKQMEPTKPENSNEDIFWEVAWEIETPNKDTERDALVWGGSVAEAPKQTDTTKESETVKKDMAKRELDEAQKKIDSWEQFASPSKEAKANEAKASADKKRVNVKDWLAWLKE